MKKQEAERLIRSVVHDWANETGFNPTSGTMPSFLSFQHWLKQHFPSASAFRSSTSPERDVEQWFDEELKQNWRN